jgi:restriction endonuclease S subunit
MSNPASTNWETTTLDSLQRADLIECMNGYSSGVHNQDGDGIPHIRPFNISPLGHSSVEQLKYIPAERHKETHSLQVRDVIFNNTNTEELVGKTAIWRHSGLFGFSNHMTRIRVKKFKEINPEFLAFYLHYHWQTGMSRQLCRRHVSQASIMGDRFFQIPVPKPSENEQTKIASILTKIQQAIEVETNLIRVTRELQAAVMKKLFTEGLSGEPQKETEIGMVPESWRRGRIGDLGRVVTGTTPPTKNSDYYLHGDIPFIAPADINENARISKVQRRITQSGLSVSRPLPRGTTCFVCIGSSIGKVGITTHDISATNQQINAVIPSEHFDCWFIYYLLLFHAHRVRAQASPSPVPILSKGNFEEIELYFPQDTERQRALANPLVKLDESLEDHGRKLMLLEELFSSALRSLMSGTIRVSELSLDVTCLETQGVAS